MKVAGTWRYLYRAVDQFGQVIDVLVSPKRDKTAARRFCTGALAGAPSPTEVSTDRAPAYPRIVEDVLPDALHSTVKYANNRVEADHGPAQGPAPTHARDQDRPIAADRRHRARVHPETCAAVTTNSPPTPPPVIEWRSRSPSSPSPSDRRRRSAASGRPLFDQRNSAGSGGSQWKARRFIVIAARSVWPDSALNFT